MTKYFIAILLFTGLIINPGWAQVKTGITGKPDSSYSNGSAYQNTLKEHPEITLVKEQPSKLVEENRALVYCTIGNRQLKLDAFVPASKKRKTAAVLVIHGGGWRSGNRAQHIPLAQRLAKAGFAAFTAEYRLSTEALYPAAVEDLKGALRWIKLNAEKYNVDSNRVAVLGFSAGGELAAFIGATANLPRFNGTCNPEASTSVQAIVDIDGTLSFVHPDSGEGNDSRSTSAATYWFGYPKKENAELWKEASPLTYAAVNKAPILFLNSAVDRMHAGRADFISILTKNNIYSEVHTFEDAPHSFCLFDPWFEPTVNYITAFLGKVLKK
jgi:acetyl esterase/lipase